MIQISVLGATGVVGQKVVALLARDPRFQIEALVASDGKIGQSFKQACDWREPLMPVPASVEHLPLTSIHEVPSSYVISCLPTAIAQTVEPRLVQAGHLVFSNASYARLHENVPLLIPEVNLNHLALIERQSTSGRWITNPNCSAVGIALALSPLMCLGEIKQVSVVTLQSLSGAGYPGISGLDALGNTIPHIPDEALKIEQEVKKILGLINQPASWSLTVQVNRVPVMYGHSVCLCIEFKTPICPQTAYQAYLSYNQTYPGLFVIHSQDGRPQPLRDLTHDDMRVHIGHLAQGGTSHTLKLVGLTHNLVRGAAGAAIANLIAYHNSISSSIHNRSIMNNMLLSI